MKSFNCFLFDCDGVLLDSNGMKNNAFAYALRDFPMENVQPFLTFQKSNFGLSRFKAFDIFFKEFMGVKVDDNIFEKVLLDFSSYCSLNYSSQDITQGCIDLLKLLNKLNISCYVVSGSEQTELQKVLKENGLSQYFKGVYGSPLSKIELILNILEIEKQNISNFIFIGDAKADYISAKFHEIKFIYLSQYSADKVYMNKLCELENIESISNLSELKDVFLNEI
ncbi:HAD hydrolase-like protein [Acinetobacter sp. YIM 103518]|uniref:phosphoglycolate phosphatase n=1 Tax=Acinetobacter faecalis TaxID=2665161 RepID=A0A6L6GFJ4_9GAMM|nr:HAD family hydrolase [Acinetobacter faecalis]MTD11291.1 HAD hydrolase-like protein [Acinetobacter faecalis]